MSLEEIVRDIEVAKKKQTERCISLLNEQKEAIIRSKDEEIAALKEEIDTLRNWLDHSALPVANPISKRKDSLNLIKMNFGNDKPAPEMWEAGEKELIESVKGEYAEEAITEPDGPETEEIYTPHEFLSETLANPPETNVEELLLNAIKTETPKIPESPLPEPPKPPESRLKPKAKLIKRPRKPLKKK
jgi:hypothetical protein